MQGGRRQRERGFWHGESGGDGDFGSRGEFGGAGESGGNSDSGSHAESGGHGGRNFSGVDRLLIKISRALPAARAPHAARAYPARSDEAKLRAHERRLSGCYMRVNHAGEICAQALYHAQAVTARDPALRAAMRTAALEEADHLAWCETRLRELGARPSKLTPLWKLGAFTFGAAAGLAGDKWNLGFLAETERQVVAHLDSHLQKLPEKDARSREVIAQMRADENAHAETAVDAGAAELPRALKQMMQLAARVMTVTAHRI